MYSQKSLYVRIRAFGLLRQLVLFDPVLPLSFYYVFFPRFYLSVCPSLLLIKHSPRTCARTLINFRGVIPRRNDNSGKKEKGLFFS